MSKRCATPELEEELKSTVAQSSRPGARRLLIIASTTVTLSALPIFTAAQTHLANTPEQLLQKIDQIRAPAETFVFDLRLTVYKDAEIGSVNEFTVHVKDSSKSIVKFTAPPKNKGRVLLMRGENLWIYIPRTRGALRISPQQRLLGPVAYGDVARVVYSLDYQVEQVRDEILDGTRVLRLDLKAKSKGAAHDRIALWAERQSLRPIKAEFLAVSGKLLKVGYYKGYQSLLGAQRPMILEIHDMIKKGERAVFEYLDMRKEDTPDFFFQRTYLEHVR